MLENFSTIWKPFSKIDDKLIDIYWKALKGYTEKQFYIAVDDTMNTLKFWPKPADIRSRISDQGQDDTLDKFILEGGHTCTKCGVKRRLTINEPKGAISWKCRPCYTGLTDQEVKGRWTGILRKLEEMGR